MCVCVYFLPCQAQHIVLVSCCPRLVNNSNVLHLFFISFVTLCVHIVHLNEWYFLSEFTIHIHYIMNIYTEFTIHIHYIMNIYTEFTIHIHYIMNIYTEFTIHIHYIMNIYTEFTIHIHYIMNIYTEFTIHIHYIIY